MHLAAQNGNMFIVKLLLPFSKESLELKDTKGRYPKDLANCDSMRELLKFNDKKTKKQQLGLIGKTESSIANVLPT